MENLSKIFFFLIFSFSLNAQSETVFLKTETNHSSIAFEIPISGFTKVRGSFTEFQIYIDYVDSDITKSTISAEIEAKSINTGIPDRDEHLRTADFFDVEQFPKIIFKSSKIIEWEGKYLAIGDFTMRGITKELVLPFVITKVDGNTMGFSSKCQINRMDYGVGSGFNHDSMEDFLGKNIEVEIDFWTKKRKK